MSKFQSFSANQTGRDFICADIHGHFYLLEQELERHQFDPGADRVFCLGDLIDRGEGNQQVLDYLDLPWFHAIMGNHEFMLIEAYEADDQEIYHRWYQWGGAWARNLRKNALKPYYDRFIELPIGIEIKLGDAGRVGLVHADIPIGVRWSQLVARLSQIPSGRFDLYQPFIHPLIWGKNLFADYQLRPKQLHPVPGIDHIFHGHYIVQPQPYTIGNRTYMDLGSYRSGKLGFLEPAKFLYQ